MLVKYDIVNSKYDNIINNLHYRMLKEEMFKKYKTTQVTLPSFIQSVSIEYDNGEIETYDVNNNSTILVLDDIYNDLDDIYHETDGDVLSSLMYNGKHVDLTNCLLCTNFVNIHYHEYVVNKIIEPVYLEKVQLYHLENVFNIINKFYGDIIFDMTYHQKINLCNKLKDIYYKNKQNYIGCSKDMLILNLIKDYYCNQKLIE